MICIGLVFYAIAGALVCTLNVEARIRGVPGVDYPNYHSIPKTSFKCSDQKYIPGFYADVETECQVFHFCFKHRSESFLCPTGTTFNQPILACDSWYSSNCSLAPLYYVVNAGPGLENAGKKIPMLLKLRDTTPDSTSARTAGVFEKISSLYEESTEQEILSAALAEKTATETVEIEDSNVKLPENESQVDTGETDRVGLDENLSQFDENQVTDELGAEHLEDENALDSRSDNPDALVDESNLGQEGDIVYDPVTDGYYMENFQSDSEWKDEPEEGNEQFQNFYDYESYYNQMIQNPESEQIQNQYVKEQYSDGASEYELEQSSSEDFNIDSSRSDLDEISEFSKRLLQTAEIPKRYRRKPAYVVVDQNSGFEYRFGNVQEPTMEPTESPFDKPISMDTLVELNTELPDDYSLVEDREHYEEFDADNALGNVEEGNVSEESEPNSYFTSQSNPELDSSEAGSYDEQKQFRMEMKDESDQNDQQSFDEYLEGVDPSERSEADLSQDSYESDGISESSASDSVEVAENAESDPDDRIIVYDDSDDPEIPSDLSGRNFAHEESAEVEESFVAETERPELDAVSDLAEDSKYDSESDPEAQNFEYTYSESNETPVSEDSDENIYVYDDSAVNEQGSEYVEKSSPGDQTYVSEEMTQSGYAQPYGVSEEASQINYAYPGQSDGVDYTQFQEPEYDFVTPEASRDELGNYYQYVNENGEPISQYENPELYQIPQVSLNGDPRIAEQMQEENYNGPENYQQGVFGDPYGYDSSQNIQYVDETGKPLSQYVNSDFYQISQGSLNGDSRISEHLQEENYDGPENLHRHGTFRNSHDYDNSQLDIQQASYMNDYPYNPQFRYYSDSGIYPDVDVETQNEFNGDGVEYADADAYSESEVQYTDPGAEIQNESNGNGFESANAYSESEVQYQEYTEQPQESIKIENTVESKVNYSQSANEMEANASGSDIEDLKNSDIEIGLVENFDNEQSDETFYVIGDEETDQLYERVKNDERYQELPNSNGGKVSVSSILPEDAIANKERVPKFAESGETQSGSEFVSVAMHEGKEKSKDPMPEFDVIDRTSNLKLPEDWSGQPFSIDGENPVTLSSALERLAALNPTAAPQSKDFTTNAEAQFLNSMVYPNSMDFGPYSFGPNMGQQFSMLDSSNSAPLTKPENTFSDQSVKPGLSQLSKLSSLQEKVRSMKRGKFGMFKKYMSSIKNQD